MELAREGLLPTGLPHLDLIILKKVGTRNTFDKAELGVFLVFVLSLLTFSELIHSFY